MRTMVLLRWLRKVYEKVARRSKARDHFPLAEADFRCELIRIENRLRPKESDPLLCCGALPSHILCVTTEVKPLSAFSNHLICNHRLLNPFSMCLPQK